MKLRKISLIFINLLTYMRSLYCKNRIKIRMKSCDKDELSIAASDGGLLPTDAEKSAGPAPSGVVAQSEADVELGSPWILGLSRTLHPALIVPGWMIGSWVWSGAQSHALPQLLSSQKCMRSSLVVEGTFNCQGHASQALSSSLHSMTGRRRAREDGLGRGCWGGGVTTFA